MHTALQAFITHFPPNSLSHAFAVSGFSVRRKKYSHAPQTLRPCLVTPLARIAVVGTVPDSFHNAILAPGINPSDISLKVARDQHALYCSALSATNITSLIQLPPNPRHPDSVFVEDPVVIISDKTAFMAKAGHPSREGEGAALETHLQQLGLRVYKDPAVNLDGGDVLKMNEFIIVGISERTERAAIASLQRAVMEDFHSNPFYETCPTVLSVQVDANLHLKSVVTWVGAFGSNSEGFLVASDTPSGRDMVDRIAACTPGNWNVVWIDANEAGAANVLYIPPTLSKPNDDTGYILVQEKSPGAVKAIQDALSNCESDLAKTVVIPVDTSEFGKANGALTCMSVIV